MHNEKQIHILLADDDKDDRFFFAKALKKILIPTVLTSVDNGETLLNYLSKGKKKFPDVLFLDVNMPRKNGMECLTEIKANKKIKDFPVIIYSTSLSPSVTDLFYEKGAHLYLKKCDFNDLVDSIAFILTQITKGTFIKQTREKFVFSLVTK
jgi:CheY-like chemotaxis protein